MTLFEPPVEARANRVPATFKRIFWSSTRGALLGAGLAALIFAWSWLPAIIDGEDTVPWYVAFWVFLGALELWSFSVSLKLRGRDQYALLARAAAAMIALSVLGYLALTAKLTLTEWASEQATFTTLVAVCGVTGVLALRGGFRLFARERSRATLWFTAAAALYASNEWAVKLGGVVVDTWRDPRVNIAYETIFLVAVLVMVGVLAVMDWNIRRRESEDMMEGVTSERSGLNNG